jgi:hypothetical protein
MAYVYRQDDCGNLEAQGGTRRVYILRQIGDILTVAELETPPGGLAPFVIGSQEPRNCKAMGSKADIVVRALVLGPLAAYVGIGTFQVFENEAEGDLRVWIPSREAIQLYVPGLKAKNAATGALIYRDAFARVEQTHIGWDPTC